MEEWVCSTKMAVRLLPQTTVSKIYARQFQRTLRARNRSSEQVPAAQAPAVFGAWAALPALTAAVAGSWPAVSGACHQLLPLRKGLGSGALQRCVSLV